MRRRLSGERCKVLLLKSTLESTLAGVALALLAVVVPSSSAGLLNVAIASLLALALPAVVVPSSSAGLGQMMREMK